MLASQRRIDRSLQKLYELSQNILLLDRQKPVDQQLASLFRPRCRCRALLYGTLYDLRLMQERHL